MSLAEPPKRPPSNGSGGGLDRRDESFLADDIDKLIAFVNATMQQKRVFVLEWTIPSKRVVELSSKDAEPKLLVTANFTSMEVLITMQVGATNLTDSGVGSAQTQRYELDSSWNIKNSAVVGNGR
jgi:hypothetical protein